VTPGSLTPEELLDSADQLLTSPIPGIGSLWPRACALLIRLALELTLDRYWARVLPSGANCGMRQQLLLLPMYGGPDAAPLAREAWLGLAGAAHHHAYELAPTAAELRGWHTTVTRLAASLAELSRQITSELAAEVGATDADRAWAASVLGLDPDG
jgi:hypothetical protein